MRATRTAPRTDYLDLFALAFAFAFFSAMSTEKSFSTTGAASVILSGPNPSPSFATLRDISRAYSRTKSAPP